MPGLWVRNVAVPDASGCLDRRLLFAEPELRHATAGNLASSLAPFLMSVSGRR